MLCSPDLVRLSFYSPRYMIMAASTWLLNYLKTVVAQQSSAAVVNLDAFNKDAVAHTRKSRMMDGYSAKHRKEHAAPPLPALAAGDDTTYPVAYGNTVSNVPFFVPGR